MQLSKSNAICLADRRSMSHQSLRVSLPALQCFRLSFSGGGERDRTDDLLRAKQALSRLSYTPPADQIRNSNLEIRNSPEINSNLDIRASGFSRCDGIMVGLDRFELSTSRLSGVRSNQLSYRPLTMRPPVSGQSARHSLYHQIGSRRTSNPFLLLRKEVIQPQVPLRLPCYDFTPITNHTLGAYLPEGLNRRLLV